MIIEHNGELSRTFVDMQKDLGIDFAIEVGAHEATFSKTISDMLNIKAVAVEANPVVFKHFVDSVISDSVQYINYAISDKDSVINMNIHEDALAGNNSIKKRSGIDIIQSYDVQAYKLDTLIDILGLEFSNLSLWIDCEGANREVLSGAVETLKKTSSIFIETEDRVFWDDQWLTDDVIAFLDTQGFKKFESEDIYDAQKNIIFIRKDK